MESEIKKIIVSLNAKNAIKGLVVVTQDGIETYGYNEKEDKDIEEVYKELIESLNVDGKKFKEIEKQLFNNRIIIGTHKNIPIRVIKDKKEFKYVIEYATGEKIVVSKEDFSTIDDYNISLNKVLTEMCDLYGINYKKNYGKVIDENNLKQLKQLGFYSEERLVFEETEEEPIYLDEDDPLAFDDEEIPSRKKKNRLKVNWKKIIAFVTAGAILGIGSYHLGRASLGKKAKTTGQMIEFENNTLAPTPYLDLASFATLEPVITHEPTVVPANETISIENQDNMFPYYINPSDGRVIVREFNKNNLDSIYRRGDGGYDFRYANLFQVRNENMENIANTIQINTYNSINDISDRNELTDTASFIYFENIEQYKNALDKAFIKYFSMMGNGIIKSAYKDGNILGAFGVNHYSKLSCSETIRLIRDDEALSVYVNGNHNSIRYSELSSETKEIVLNLAWSNSITLNSNPEDYMIKGQEGENTELQELHYQEQLYTKKQIQEIILNKYNELETKKIK